MNLKNLYLVQDADRPLYVLAVSWMDALRKWQEQIAKENPDSTPLDDDQPQGIQLIAEADEVLT